MRLPPFLLRRLGRVLEAPLKQALLNRARLRSLVDRCDFPFAFAEIELAWSGDLLFVVCDEFLPLGQPAGGPRNRKQYGEHRRRESHRLVNNAGIEIDIRVKFSRYEVVVVERDLFEFRRDVDQRILAGFAEHCIGRFFNDLRTRIVVL